MVVLTEKLLEILALRKDTLTGLDIKYIVESIQLSESMVKVVIDPNIKTAEQIIKDWRGE